MTRETVDGRPVYLCRRPGGWAVKWGRTQIGSYPTWQEALAEIMKLYEVV